MQEHEHIWYTYAIIEPHYIQIEADQYEGNEDWKASWLFDLPVWIEEPYYSTSPFVNGYLMKISVLVMIIMHVLPCFLCRNVAIGKVVDGEVKITISIFNSNSDPTKPHDEL